MLSCLFLSLTLSPQAAKARLGESFQSYKLRVAKAFIAAGEKKTDNNINYMYKLAVDSQQTDTSPGYAVGITITCAGSKIVRQSMAIRTGTNPTAGTSMAALHGFVFAYEAIGKSVPADNDKASAEFQTFSEAVGQALSGKAQSLRYPGLSGAITIVRDASGNLIISAKS
ncbi:MAG: hypothetical protein HY711_03060 [Candidatus Melainabacteria bacterium]|nr:hypothetical protein [Candidatus Melainabacteria bacterium]